MGLPVARGPMEAVVAGVAVTPLLESTKILQYRYVPGIPTVLNHHGSESSLSGTPESPPEL